MIEQISLGKIIADVHKKNIKNIHLGVYPPGGKVRIAVPLRMSIEAIRIFAISKLDWIKKQQKKFQEQERHSPREYIDRESHYVWGKRYLLKIIETDQLPGVELQHNQICLQITPGTTNEKKQAIIEKWYRQQIKKLTSILIAKWESRMGVKVTRFFVQRMKTKWGSCRPESRHIRINAMLSRKPQEYLEYIIVHEMAHLLEPTHNHRFMALMDQFMPKWRFYRQELNRLPLEYEQWKYPS